MSKYIIEIEGEPFVKLSALFGKEGLYRAKGFKSLVFDQLGLDKLTPLDKELEEAYQKGKHDAEQDLARAAYEEAYQKGFEAGQHEATTLEYQQGLDDAWEAARKIAQQWEEETDTEHRVVIDDSIRITLDSMTASEAIAKIKAYEQQKADDEIKVGDEVDYKGMTKYVVTGIVDDDTICGFSLNGLWNANTIKEVTKTGRHFPQVAELLEAMKEGAE